MSALASYTQSWTSLQPRPGLLSTFGTTGSVLLWTESNSKNKARAFNYTPLIPRVVDQVFQPNVYGIKPRDQCTDFTGRVWVTGTEERSEGR